MLLPPTVLLKLCAPAGAERVVTKVELLEVLAAKKSWCALGKVCRSPSGLLRRQLGRPLRVHEGYRPSRLRASLLSACWTCDMDSLAASWYERVPGPIVRTTLAGLG